MPIFAAIGTFILVAIAAIVTWYQFKFMRFFIVLALKIAVFWIVFSYAWEIVSELFLQGSAYASGYLPAPTDPFVAMVMRTLKVTAAWFPWEFLGNCVLIILSFKLTLLVFKLVRMVIALIKWIVDFAGFSEASQS